MAGTGASGNTGRVRGYHEASYGEGFADVYDDWYAGVSDVAATTAGLAALAGAGPVLELGVGTGRLAVPLAATGLHVHGVDTSQAMLERLTARLDAMSPRPEVTGVLGDMVDGLPPGPFTLVFVAYNTFFSLLTEERQRVGDVRRTAAPPLVHGVDQEAEAHAVHVIGQEVLSEPARERHQVVEGDRTGHDNLHGVIRPADRVGHYFRYLPMIGAR